MSSIYNNAFFVLMIFVSFSQETFSQETDNIIGKKFTIESKILSENRDIQIYFPESYNSSQKDYPVLYILDGQRLYLHGVSILQSFRNQVKISPEFIVVGINNKYPERFSHFTKSMFLEFIDTELVRYIDKNYRTTNERILYGWEFAGAYVLEALINKPKLFTGHIAASPYPIHQTWFGEKTRIEQLEDKLNKDLNSHLYFAVSAGEPLVEDGTNKLDSLLKAKAPSSLRWTYRIIPDEQHLSTAHATLYQGLKDYYYSYEVFQIDGLEKFIKAGGLKNFYMYNKKRAERFGFPEKPEIWSMFTIVRNAMRADNFDQFDLFMKEFKPFDIIKNVELRNSNSFAEYYLE